MNVNNISQEKGIRLKIRKLFRTDCFPYHLVVETIDGEYKKFYINPARWISEKDLSPLPHWNPIGRNGREAEPYIYKMYGLEK